MLHFKTQYSSDINALWFPNKKKKVKQLADDLESSLNNNLALESWTQDLNQNQNNIPLQKPSPI